MVRTATADRNPSNASKTQPAAPPDSNLSPSPKKKPGAAKEDNDHASGKYGLAKGPLGIVLAGLFLVEAVMGMVVRSNLPPAATIFVTCAMVVLAFAVFAGFFYVWIRKPPGYLHHPAAFRDDANYLAAVNPDMLRSEPLLPTPAPAHPSSPIQIRPGEGFAPGSTVLDIELPLSPADNNAWLTGELSGGMVSSTLVMSLSNHLKSKSDWGYLRVESDHAWLLSRLFIFVSLYRAMRPLPCIVFTQSEGKIQKLLGVADPARVLSGIARLHPHFNTALAAILAAHDLPISMSGAIDEQNAIDVITEFVHALQSSDDHGGEPEWSNLNPATWEHSRWLDPGMIKKELASALFDPRASVFRLPDRISDNDLVFEVMKRDSRFVATVGDSGEFLQLYDKHRLFDEFRHHLQAAS